MENLFHSITDTEYRVMNTCILLKMLKLDDHVDELIDIIHDANIACYHRDFNVTQVNQKAEYPISEIFNTSYFSRSNRDRSRDISTKYFAKFLNKFLGAFCEKYNCTFQLNFSPNKIAYIYLSFPEANLSTLDRNDTSNYAIKGVLDLYFNTPEEDRNTISVYSSDEYGNLSKAGFNNGCLTTNIHFNCNNNCTMANVAKLYDVFTSYRQFQKFLENRINE